MPQAFVQIVLDGFNADDYDFAGALQRKPQGEQQAFAAFVEALIDAEVNPADDIFWSVTIVGHSDRYDVAGVSSDERRSRELGASKERAASAFNYLILQEFAAGVTAAGLTPPTTTEDPTNVGVTYAVAGAANLVHPTPTSEAERTENRRVKFNVICFSPQPSAIAFGEQLDRNIDIA